MRTLVPKCTSFPSRRHRGSPLSHVTGSVRHRSSSSCVGPVAPLKRGRAYGGRPDRRVHACLAREGTCVSRKRVERLMRCASLSGLVRRRRGRTTIRVACVAVVPDRLWVADLTYLRS